MSDRPPLPVTDNPFELLGVDPGASERDLKRAYVRLIKIYRPERDPDAFQRIQAAYEAATESGWLFQAPDDSDDAELDEPSAEACDEPESWPDPSPPENPVLDEIERFIEAGDLAAAFAHSRHLEDSLDVIVDEHTESRLLRIACAFAWFWPKDAETLYQRAGGRPDDRGFYHDLFDDLRGAIPSKLTQCWPHPLGRLLAIGPIVDEPGPLCRDLYGDLYRNPSAYWYAIDGIGTNQAPFQAIITALDWLDDGEEPDSEPPPLDDAIRWVDRKLAGHRVGEVFPVRWLGLLVLVGPAARLAPLVLLAALAVVVGIVAWRWFRNAKPTRYPTVISVWLRDVVFRYQVSPEQVAHRVDESHRRYKRIARYSHILRRDRPAYILWRLIAVGRAALAAQASDG